MVKAAIKGQSARIQWPYSPTELVYGKDAAKGTVSGFASRKNLKGTISFTIGSGELIGGDDVHRELKKNFPNLNITLQKKGKIPLPHPELQILNDNSRSREQLGYEPDYPLEQALADYAATLRKIEAHSIH